MDELIRYAYSFVKTPYVFGDKSPVIGGFDCSGFVCEILRMAGEVGNSEILNAQMLFDRFSQNGRVGVSQRGCLAFYGESLKKISHVAFMVSSYQILEAGGGDSTTTSVEAADKRGGMVRGRLVQYRKDLLCTIRPHYTKIGAI
jgi:cell wall-associated NlpC family hydrolase